MCNCIATGLMINKDNTDKKTEELDVNAPTRTETIGLYMCLVCGLLVLIAGLDMTFSGATSTGWSPAGRFSVGRPGSINGPAAIVFAILILSVGLFGLRKRSRRSK
jgi:hypothetical protein